MASDLAIVAGFCGVISGLPFLAAVVMGEQPVAWAPKNRVFAGSTQPSFCNSPNAFATLVMSEPPAIGMTTFWGSRQPSCSATSKPSVFDPSE